MSENTESVMNVLDLAEEGKAKQLNKDKPAEMWNTITQDIILYVEHYFQQLKVPPVPTHVEMLVATLPSSSLSRFCLCLRRQLNTYEITATHSLAKWWPTPKCSSITSSPLFRPFMVMFHLRRNLHPPLPNTSLSARG